MTKSERAIDLVTRYTNLDKSRDLGEQLEAIFSPDFINHSATGSVKGLDKLKGFVASAREWMPDIDVSINTIFANESSDGSVWVGAQATLRGTLAENNKSIEMQEVWIFRVCENKIAERWYVYDQAELGS